MKNLTFRSCLFKIRLFKIRLFKFRLFKFRRFALWVAAVSLATASMGFSQTAATTSSESKSIPVVDGGIGPCSADFTVTDANGSPVYAAQIDVHIAYGFMHKLDLEVGTNADGKARFTGLPNRVKHGLFFQASQGDRTADAFDDPASTCKTQFTLALRKKL